MVSALAIGASKTVSICISSVLILSTMTRSTYSSEVPLNMAWPLPLAVAVVFTEMRSPSLLTTS